MDGNLTKPVPQLYRMGLVVNREREIEGDVLRAVGAGVLPRPDAQLGEGVQHVLVVLGELLELLLGDFMGALDLPRPQGEGAHHEDLLLTQIAQGGVEAGAHRLRVVVQRGLLRGVAGVVLHGPARGYTGCGGGLMRGGVRGEGPGGGDGGPLPGPGDAPGVGRPGPCGHPSQRAPDDASGAGQPLVLLVVLLALDPADDAPGQHLPDLEPLVQGVLEGGGPPARALPDAQAAHGRALGTEPLGARRLAHGR